MRFFRKARGIAAVAGCLLCGAFAFCLTRSPVFSGEGYELYPRASSSAGALVTEQPARDKFFLPVEGESARYAGDCAAELIAAFRAEVVFTEEACGAVHYYCRSPLLRGGVVLYGARVNLHVATDGAVTTAGTPLIFGGA